MNTFAPHQPALLKSRLRNMEKALAKEGLKREQIGREEFLRRTWAWKEKYGGIITQQIRRLGASCDWERERFTMDEGLSRAVREVFVRLYEEDLIYRGEWLVNWCPSCETVLANEQVEEGGCWRCDSQVIQKELDQWFFRITAYAEELLEDTWRLPGWPEPVLIMQRNWIGRSLGCEVDFAVSGRNEKVRVFTTRPDTLFGATYMVLAPEHELVDRITTDKQKKVVQDYREQASRKSDLDRTDLAKEKTGVFTGSFAINTVNDQKIPIWISDYVLISYGTGFCVLAFESRDANVLAFSFRRDEFFYLSAPIKRDQMIRHSKNIRGAAKIFFELDDGSIGPVAFEGQYVVDIGAAPAIDGLVRVASRANIVVARSKCFGD